MEQARVDMIVDCLDDTAAKPIMGFMFEKDETIKVTLVSIYC